MTPPNADSGSQACALRCASATSAPIAMPHGLACLMIATHGLVVVVRGTARGVGVRVVVVRHLLAVQLLGLGETAGAGDVERGGLVRVLAVAQDVLALAGRAEEVGEAASRRRARSRPRTRRPRPRRTRRCAGRPRRRAACGRSRSKPPSCDGGEDVGVPRGAGDDGDGRVVLGGGADHRGAADVDLLDALVGGGAGGDGLPERVEVHDHQVERLDAQLGELLAVVLQAQVGEDAGVHPGVQGLDPAVQALGEAGELLDLGDRHPGGGDLRGGGAGGDELDARLVQPAGELFEPRLVVDADQRAPDGAACSRP